MRRLVMESEVLLSKGYEEDPTLMAGKMTSEDVLKILREEEGVWYDGVDWIERRKNEEEALRRGAEVEDHDNAILTIRTIPSPIRQKKRCSEELEEGDVAIGNKRPKLDESSKLIRLSSF